MQPSPYKGNHVELEQIGRELNVRYVLEASVQRSGNRLRVNVQLIDAEFGHHLWAERFEEDVVDFFKLRNQIWARLANTFGHELSRVEAAKGAQSTNPDMGLRFDGRPASSIPVASASN
jgi:TolB-like protein